MLHKASYAYSQKMNKITSLLSPNGAKYYVLTELKTLTLTQITFSNSLSYCFLNTFVLINIS